MAGCCDALLYDDGRKAACLGWMFAYLAKRELCQCLLQSFAMSVQGKNSNFQTAHPCKPPSQSAVVLNTWDKFMSLCCCVTHSLLTCCHLQPGGCPSAAAQRGSPVPMGLLGTQSLSTPSCNNHSFSLGCSNRLVEASFEAGPWLVQHMVWLLHAAPGLYSFSWQSFLQKMPCADAWPHRRIAAALAQRVCLVPRGLAPILPPGTSSCYRGKQTGYSH